MVSKILYTYKINSFMYDRIQSLANLWICAREILWLACPRPSGKLLTLIEAKVASSLKKNTNCMVFVCLH